MTINSMKLSYLMIVVMLCAFLCSCGNDGKNNKVSQEDVAFIKGADISTLEEVEDLGGVFYDFDGNETDAIEFLVDNGCNYFRLRVWNDPSKSYDKNDYCNAEHTVEMAKRIKEAGGYFLLDFHYSDWWADPQNQTIPEEWKGKSQIELVKAVYDYTADVLNKLADAGAYPDMVQIGNEIGNGMLWGYGDMDKPEKLAELINSGIKAVRDTTPAGQKTKVMLHVQFGGSVEQTESFFTMIEDNGVVDYDVVGLSYYPYWNGTCADLKSNIDNVYSKFKKEVVVVELAYPFTNENADYAQNSIIEKDIKNVGFDASESNQRKIVESVMSVVASCEGGLGVFYWEPTWITVKDRGVKGSSVWENQAIFDFDGKPLEAVKAFRFDHENVDENMPLSVYPLPHIEIDKATKEEDILEELPKTAKVLYLDGTIKDVEIEWDKKSKNNISGSKISFKGKAAGFDISVVGNVTDKYVLNNLSFEDGDSGWIISGDMAAGRITDDSQSYPKEGRFSFVFWDDNAFTVEVYQYVKIAEAGTYKLQVWTEGKEEVSLELYIADSAGNHISSTEFENAGWSVWQHPMVSASLNEGDIVRIGIKVNGKYDDWGAIDGFEFYLDS